MRAGFKAAWRIVVFSLVCILIGGTLGYFVGFGAGEQSILVSEETVLKQPKSTEKASQETEPQTSSTASLNTDSKDMEEELMQLTEPIKVDKTFKVVGYYPSWGGNDHDKIQFDVLTHINYSFAIPTEEGGLRPLENPERAQSIIKEAHKQGVKVLIAIGGWSYNEIPLEQAFKSATQTPEKIAKLVDAIMKLVDEYGFDGVDMDWEHPRFGEASQQQYMSLMVGLRTELNKRNLLLTAAVVSGPTADGNILYDAGAHTDEVIALVDWLNIMAYDGGDGDRHSSYDFAVNCGNYWSKTRGIAKEKCVLGLPFYGRPTWGSYEALLTADADAHKKDITLYNGSDVYYNGIQTIQKKTQFAAENLGGVMIWEITQDTSDKEKSLQNAIGEAIRK